MAMVLVTVAGWLAAPASRGHYIMDGYLQVVRTLADNVLAHGGCAYGPKKTPLFVDGINIDTLKPPVFWMEKGYFHCTYDGEGRTRDNDVIYSRKRWEPEP